MNDEVAEAGAQAELGRPPVGNDPVGDFPVPAFNQPGPALGRQSARTALDAAEESFDPLRQRLIVARGEKSPQSRHVLTALGGRK